MTTATPPITHAVEATPKPDACDACEHPLSAHDALGLRFCHATQSSALTRGCICR